MVAPFDPAMTMGPGAPMPPTQPPMLGPGGIPGMPGMAPPMPVPEPEPEIPDDEMLFAAIEEALAAADAARIGPVLPPTFAKPPKPDKAWVLERAAQDEADHQEWLRLIVEILARLNDTWVGFFEGDEEDIENGRVQTAHSPALRAIHRKLCVHVAGMETAYDCPYLDEVDREESRDKEDALAYWRRKEVEQFAEAYGQDLDWAEVDILAKYGVVIALTKLDPEAPGGFRDTLLDPGTTFPTFAGDGLAYVTRKYETDAARLVGAFPDPNGTLARKVLGTATVGAKEGTRKPDERVCVVEYIDRWWHGAWVGEEEVFLAAHEFNQHPVTVQYLPLGDQFATTTPTPMGRRSDASTPDDLLASGWGTERSRERVRKAVPFIFHLCRAHDQGEALAGILVTMLKRMRDPSWIHAKDTLAGEINPIDAVSMDPGEITSIGLEDKLEPNLPQIQPALMQWMMGFLSQNEALMGVSQAVAGTMPGAQTTGSALTVLTNAGAADFIPVARAIERFRQRKAKKKLELFRDWAPLMGEWGAKGAGITVPRRGAAALRLTREMVQRTGTEVDVRLNRFAIDEAGQAATVAQILGAGGFASQRRLIELLRIVPDPDREIDRIREEQFMETIEMQQTALADYLMDQFDLARRRNDRVSMAKIQGKMALLAENQMQQALMKAKMAGQLAGPAPGSAPPGGEPPPPGVPPEDGGGAGMVGPDVGYQGASMPQYGAMAGAAGGRPVAPPPPPYVPGGM